MPTLTVNQRVLITAVAGVAGTIAGLALPAGVPDYWRLVPPIAALLSAQLTSFLHETPQQQSADLTAVGDALPVLETFVTMPPDKQKAVIDFLKAAAVQAVETTTTTTTTETVGAPVTQVQPQPVATPGQHT